MTAMPERDGYRDELAAAQARIATLEQELSAMRGTTAQDGPDPRLTALEDKYRRLTRAAEPKVIRRTALGVALLPVVVMVSVGVLLVATGESFGFFFVGLGTLMAVGLYFLLTTVGATNAKQLAENARAELQEARRLRAVERALADARPRVRVEDEPEEASPGDDASATKRSRSG